MVRARRVVLCTGLLLAAAGATALVYPPAGQAAMSWSRTATWAVHDALHGSDRRRDAAGERTFDTDGAAQPTSPSPLHGQKFGQVPGQVTFAFAGDVHFESLNRDRLLEAPRTVFGPIARTLQQADITMVNLETAITDGGVAENKKFTFRAPASAFTALSAAGVDVVTMANNHGMDYGQQGLQDTLTAASTARFPVVGIGKNEAAAYAPWRTTVNGTRVAILGASQVMDSVAQARWTARPDQPGVASAYRAERLVKAVRQARASSDLVVVYLHWGAERDGCPTDKAKTLAEELAAAGADVLVGAHAHVLNGDGFLGGTYVHYGLGNFLWYSSEGPTTTTGVLKLTLRGREVVSKRWLPAQIRNQRPVLLSKGVAEAVAVQESRRACTGLASEQGFVE